MAAVSELLAANFAVSFTGEHPFLHKTLTAIPCFVKDAELTKQTEKLTDLQDFTCSCEPVFVEATSELWRAFKNIHIGNQLAGLDFLSLTLISRLLSLLQEGNNFSKKKIFFSFICYG